MRSKLPSTKIVSKYPPGFHTAIRLPQLHPFIAHSFMASHGLGGQRLVPKQAAQLPKLTSEDRPAKRSRTLQVPCGPLWNSFLVRVVGSPSTHFFSSSSHNINTAKNDEQQRQKRSEQTAKSNFLVMKTKPSTLCSLLLPHATRFPN